MLSKPKVTGRDKDALADFYKSLEGDIRDSMFTRTDMEKGLADPHQELERQKTPGFNIKPHSKLFHQMGIPVSGGKATRDQLCKAYKVAGKLLGENTNVERLRKDRYGGTYTEDVPMDRVGN